MLVGSPSGMASSSESDMVFVRVGTMVDMVASYDGGGGEGGGERVLYYDIRTAMSVSWGMLTKCMK